MHLPQKLQIQDFAEGKEHKPVLSETVSPPSIIWKHLINVLYIPFSDYMKVNV